MLASVVTLVYGISGSEKIEDSRRFVFWASPKNSGCDAADRFGDISGKPILLRYGIERLASPPQLHNHVDLKIIGRDHRRTPPESRVDDHGCGLRVLLKGQSCRRTSTSSQVM